MAGWKSSTRAWIKDNAIKTWEEIQSSLVLRWRQILLWFFFTFWSIGLFNLTDYVAYPLLYLQGPSSACRPDGTFSPFDNYSSWVASEFFQINLAFGKFSYTEAKVIDTFWDIVVGRLGQAVLAFFSWRSFADYTAISMASSPVTYNQFSILILESTPSFASTLSLAWMSISASKTPGGRAATTLIVVNMLFVLAWPTLTAAMTGYVPTVDAYVRDFDDTLVKYTEFSLLAYILHDGWRVNLDGDYAVLLVDRPPLPGGELLYSTGDLENEDSSCFEDYYNISNCNLKQTISDYTSRYGFNGSGPQGSKWMGQDVLGPPLNIEPFLLNYRLSSAGLSEGWFGWNVSNVSKRPAWTYENRTYTLEDVQSRGTCKTVGDTFQWGFSYIQLTILTSFLIAWTFSIYSLWLASHIHLPFRNQPERLRRWRAHLLLAKTINEQFHEHGIDADALPDRKLKREIHKQLDGGSMSFDFPLRKARYTRRDFVHWARRDLGWCLVSLVLTVLSYSNHFVSIVYYSWIAVILLTCLIARTAKGRLFLWICLLPLPVAITFYWNSFGGFNSGIRF